MRVAEQLHVITHPNGIHMRVAGKLSAYANEYSGEIELHDKINKCYVNSKNPLNIMLFALEFGQEITIHVSGDNALQTIAEVKSLL